MKTIASIVILSIGTAAWSAGAGPDLSKLPPPSDKKGLTYAKDIRPILEASCFKCHGDNRPKAGLRLNSLEAVLKGGDDGKVVIPEKSQDSLLVVAAAQIDDETAMPPKRGPGGGGGGGGGGFGPGMALAPQMMSQGDKDGDKKLSKDEFTALADTWYDKLDPEKTAMVTQQQFTARFGEILPAQGNRGGAQGGGQRPGGGPGGFGPGRFIAPGLFTAMDADKDGSLTRVEVKDTFTKWFAEWDKDKSGALSEDQLKAGLSAALPQPNFRGQAGGGGGGGAGGPGARGPQAGGAGRGGPGQGGPGQGGQRPGQAGAGQGGAGQGGPGGGGGQPTKPLTPEQVGLVRAWIDQGAK